MEVVEMMSSMASIVTTLSEVVTGKTEYSEARAMTLSRQECPRAKPLRRITRGTG